MTGVQTCALPIYTLRTQTGQGKQKDGKQLRVENGMEQPRRAVEVQKDFVHHAYVIALAIEGKQLDSVELSQKIDSLGTSGISHIIFVIGGSLGLAERILKRADYKLSFSKMTFPHQLMRVILSEQIYRSYRIINHEPYHK